MPELPEVETVKKALLKKVQNKKILNIKILYSNIFENQDVEEVKNLIKNQTINEDEELRYKDTRKFGRMYLLKKDELNKFLASKLGYEPWDKNLTIAYLKENLKNKTLPIKTLLLDQKLIAGIGNIYADEILFLSKINPHRKGKSLNDEELEKIIENTKKVLEQAIKDGGTTIRSYTSVDNKIGSHQNNLLVHKKENEKCLICKNLIKKDRINGRSTYYCSNCQK